MKNLSNNILKIEKYKNIKGEYIKKKPTLTGRLLKWQKLQYG